jgi:hypothetical protein
VECGKLWGTTADDGPAVVPQDQSPSTNQSSMLTKPEHFISSSSTAPQALNIVHTRNESPTIPVKLPSHLSQTNSLPVSNSLTTDLSSSVTDIVTSSENLSTNAHSVVLSTISSNTITDVYLLDDAGQAIRTQTSNPFLTVPHLHGPQGERIRILAIVDNGAMINAIDTAAFQRIARRLSPLSPSSRTLRMADGSLVSSTGVWTGTISWGPINIQTAFEVFPSGGSWRMLIGKPLLEQVRAIHDYSSDAILLPHGNDFYRISNFTTFRPLPLPCLPTAIRFPSSTIFNQTVPSSMSIPEQNDNDNKNILHVPTIPSPIDVHKLDSSTNTSIQQAPSNERNADELTITPHQAMQTDSVPQSVFEVEDIEQVSTTAGDVLDPSTSTLPKDIFTRLTEHGPFWPAQVEAIVNAVRYGEHLTEDQWAQTQALIAEFADVFTLSV